MGFWPVVLNVLKNSDVVLLLADARMSEETVNKEIIRKVEAMKGKRILLLFNKSDLVSEAELNGLKQKNHGAYFISAGKKKGVRELKKHLENMADNFNEPSLRIGIVGYPNVGKSTLINLLAPGARAKISKVSGTTKKTQWIRTGRLRIMDSPGVIPRKDSSTFVGLIGAKDPHKLKNPERVAIEIITKKKKAIKEFYGISEEGEYALFLAIGKKKGFLLKKGEIDERRTAIKIIEDWNVGKITS